MNFFTDIEQLASLKGESIHLAIGVFDGIHLGHQKVIKQSISAAAQSGGTVVVVTFDPHPISILSPDNAPNLLTSIEHKSQILYRLLKVKYLLAIPFDQSFASLSGREFIDQLTKAATISSISVGENFQFGKNRSGNVTLLENLAGEMDFELFSSSLLEIDTQIASSTRIREAIASGNFKLASNLLGRPYRVLGTVIKGRQMGRTIGFPTANLDVHGEQLPPDGVYAVCVQGNGDSWHGVANLGFRPTVEGAKASRLLEVNLFGLDHEIYGQNLEVEFVHFLRSEQKFDGIEALTRQIQADAEQAKNLLK